MKIPKNLLAKKKNSKIKIETFNKNLALQHFELIKINSKWEVYKYYIKFI